MTDKVNKLNISRFCDTSCFHIILNISQNLMETKHKVRAYVLKGNNPEVASLFIADAMQIHAFGYIPPADVFGSLGQCPVSANHNSGCCHII